MTVMSMDECKERVKSVLSAAPMPLTSRQVFEADSKFPDFKQVTNAISSLQSQGELTRDGGGYVIGQERPRDPASQRFRVHPALALLGRQDFGPAGIDDFEIKVSVLKRLEQITEASISRVLHAVREDMERFNSKFSDGDGAATS